MKSYAAMCDRRRREFGDRFDDSELSAQFVSHYESGKRVRVRFGYGEEMTGTIGVTTGWRPCFLLMRRSNDHGSSWTLSDRDEIVAVQYGRTYVPVANLYVRPGTQA